MINDELRKANVLFYNSQIHNVIRIFHFSLFTFHFSLYISLLLPFRPSLNLFAQDADFNNEKSGEESEENEESSGH